MSAPQIPSNPHLPGPDTSRAPSPGKTISPLARHFPVLILAAALLTSLPTLALQLQNGSAIPAAPFPLLTLVLTALAGRTALALLPPGSPGTPIPVIWGTSHLLGVILISAEALLFKSASIQTLTLPWLLLGLAMALTGPGDLSPRHLLKQSPIKTPLARALQITLVILALVPLAAQIAGRTLLQHTPTGATLGLLPGPATQALGGTSPITPLAAAALPAMLLIVHHALRNAGQTPARRLAATLALCALPLPFALFTSTTSAALPHSALAAAAAAAFGACALIRADRRAAYLSLIASLSLAWLLPASLAPLALGLPAAGMLALVAAHPDRARLAKPFAAALAAAIAIAIIHQATPEPSTQAPLFAALFALFQSWDLVSFGALFFLVDASALVLFFRQPWRQPRRNHAPQEAKRPRPELFFAFAIASLSFVFALVAGLAAQGIWPQSQATWNAAAPSLLAILAPSALLMLALCADEILPGQNISDPREHKAP